MWRRLSLGILILLLGLAGCGGERGTIRIYVSFPQQGGYYQAGLSRVRAVRLAVADRGGKVLGRKVELRVFDDASPQTGLWDPDLEAEIARRAAQDPQAVAYIGPANSGAARVSMPILNEANLPQISPSNTYPGLTRPGFGEGEPERYRPTGKVTYFRVIPTDDLQGKVGAQWAARLGFHRVYVVHDGSVYGKGIAQIFAEQARKEGLEVLAIEEIDPTTTHLSETVDRILVSEADLVYFGGLTATGGVVLVTELRQRVSRDEVGFMGPDGLMNRAFVEGAGAAAEGAYITFVGFPPDQLPGQGKEFVARYREAYGEDPDPMAPYAYEATAAVLEAMVGAGSTDREKVRQALLKMRFQGLLGPFRFDENGDTTRILLSGNVVQGGELVFAASLQFGE